MPDNKKKLKELPADLDGEEVTPHKSKTRSTLHELSAADLEGEELPTDSNNSVHNNLWQTNKPAYVDSVLNANKHLNWVQRLYDKNPETIQVEGEEFPSTHLMSDNGKGYVFPTIQKVNGKLTDLGQGAEDYARETNTGIQLPKEQGTWFSNNGYKTGSNVLSGSLSAEERNKILGIQDKQDIVNNIFGKDISGNPVINTTPHNSPQLIDPKEETNQAVNILANHVVQNALPHYEENLKNIPFTEPGSVVHDITNPHGDGQMTGSYAKHAIEQLKLQRHQELANLAFSGGPADPDYPQQENAINSKYNEQIAALQNAALHLTSLQLANREYTAKKYTQEESDKKISDLNREYKKELEVATGGGDVNVAKTAYEKAKAEIKRNTKYDAVQLGIEQQKILGNKIAEEDLVKYNNGQPIPDDRKVAYQLNGLNVIQTGARNASANGLTEVAQDMADHSDDIEGRLKKDNPRYFQKQYAQEIGGYLYNNEHNPLFGTLFARGIPDEKKIKAAGKAAGLTPEQIRQVRPEDIPTAASMLGQGAQGAFNAFLFQGEKDPYGELFTGKMPQEQHTFNNWRGVTGEIASGAGTVAGFLAQGGIIGEGLKSAELLGNVATKAKSYETASNLIPLALSNYNNAYEQSKEVIGDKPKDELKRHAYAALNATIATAIMSIDPATALGKEALGATKGGRDIISMLKKDGLSDISRNDFKDKIQQVISHAATTGTETAKHAGSQALIMASNKAAENVTDMFFDPEHRHGLMDNVGQSALQAGISMFLPSLFAGINTSRMENPSNKELLWDVGNNSKEYRTQVTDLYKQGKMSKDDFFTAVNGINKAAGIIKSDVPTSNAVNDVPLTDQQKKDYAWNLLQSNEISDKISGLGEGKNVDKSQTKLLNDRLADLTAERDKILEKAGEDATVEKPVLKITTEPEVTQPTAEKKSDAESKEELSLKSDNDISIDEQLKSTSNEKSTSNHEDNGQDRANETSSQEIGSNPELRQAAGMEGQQAGESRQIEETPGGAGNNKEGGAEMQPPISVSGKVRRKRKPLVVDEDVSQTESEKIHTTPNDERSVATDAELEPVAAQQKVISETEKPIENASTQSEGQQQEVIQQGSEPEHARTEQAGIEEPATETAGSDSNERSERGEEKEVKFKTAKGSEYVLHSDGTTTRNKAPREDVGHEGEQGIQPRSEKTYFITKEDLGKLDKVQTSGWPEGEVPTIADIGNGKIAVGITGGERHGKYMPETEVKYSTEPQTGLYPLEVRENGTVHHFGNEITEVQDTSSENDLLPPQPAKALNEMTGEELSDYYQTLKEFNKNLDKTVLGDKYEEYNKAQRVSNSSFSSDEARKKAYKVINEIEGSLSEKQQYALFGRNIPEGFIINEEEVKDFRDKVQTIESSQSESELARDIAQSLIDLNNAPKDFDKMSVRQKLAVVAMKTAKRIIEERGYDGKEVTDQALKSAYDKFEDRNDAEFMLSRYIDFAVTQQNRPGQKNIQQIGKPQEAPQSNGAIATEATKEQPAQPPKEKTPVDRLSEIEEDLKKQRASQKLEGEKRAKAEKENDIPAANKANENWYKKKEKIDKLEDEKESIQKKMDREEREESIRKSYNDFADKLERKYEANKEKNKGLALSGIVGLSTKIGDHVADYVVARSIEGIRELANVDIAIRRVIRLAKEKFGAEADELSEKDIPAIKAHLMGKGGQKEPRIEKEPVLPIDHEEYAKDIIADIKDGVMTLEEGLQEIADEQILNRQGQPVSDHVAENNKAKIQNYIKWHIDQDLTSIKNATTRLRREQFGLNEEIPAAKKEFGTTWDEAKQKIEDNPQKIPLLIQELSKKARPLTDVENAILLHHQNTKEIELLSLNDKINKAAEQGTAADILEYKVSKSRVLDELQQIYDINKAVGTENARGLSSRRMMVDRKYSLVNMLSEKRATANEGKPLTEQQQAQVESLHKKIKETQDAFDNYVKKAESQIIDLQRKALGGKLKDKKTASTKLREWAERIRNASKNQAYSSPIPITPHMVADAIDLIAYGVEKGEQLVDLVKKAVAATSKGNPDIDEQELEREINKALIESGILEVSPERRAATDMSGLFTNGKLDREAVRLKTDADRAKAQFDINVKKDQQAELSGGAKAQNWFVKWERAGKLSNPLTLGKLFNAGFTRLITTPLEDAVGGAYSAILPQLANGSIGEGGGLNVNETAKAYKNGLMLGIKDARAIMSKKSQGKSELDVLFGKTGELPPEAIDFFGQLHSATKAPFKRIMFERSLERRSRRIIASGADITDPMVQTSVLVGAYKDANRAIFMQDNKVAEAWQKLIKHFGQIDPKTGEPRSQSVSTAMQVLVPFVKVPSNIVAETGKHIYGVPVAAFQLLRSAFTKGIENLSEDQKDIILRNLKKGSLGVSAMALGYFNAQNFGGYYQPGQKRDKDDAEALGFKVFGHKVPAWVGEAPIFQAMQFGATVKRVSDHFIDGEPEGLTTGLETGLLDVVQSNPLASQPLRIGALFKSSKERQYYLGELAKSTIDPAIITYLAKVTDPADEGNPIRKMLAPENKRKTPKTIVEHIKSGLPFLREDLPEK